MAPQALKFYILHDICVVSLVSVFPRSETAYLSNSKNRPISKLKKKMLWKEIKIWNSPKSSCKAPQELEFYILHGLCAVGMVPVLSGSKTAYLAISAKCYKEEILMYFDSDLEIKEKML